MVPFELKQAASCGLAPVALYPCPALPRAMASSPAPSQYSVTEEWRLSSPGGSGAFGAFSAPGVAKPCTSKELRDIVLESASRALEVHGSTLGYLWKRFGTEAARAAHVAKLFKAFPPSEGAPLPVGPDLQPNASTTVHLAMLSIDPARCPREPASVYVVRQLVDSIMTDGFLTEHEPLRICSGGPEEMARAAREAVGDMEPPWKQVSAVLPMCLGHHKSASRVAALHLIVQLFIDDEVDMEQAFPALYHSVRNIRCVNVEFATKRGQLLDNMKLSTSGAIRKAPNVLSWVIGLRRLQECGDADQGAIVREWNEKCMSGSQLQGAKAQAVKLILMQCDMEALDILTKCVSEFGWEGCPFSEDALSSKKLYSGKNWNGKSKRWTALSEVSSQSITVMLQHVVNAHRKQLEVSRRKRSRQDLEIRAQAAAIVVNVGQEFVKSCPVGMDAVQEAWVQPFIDGSPRVEMELQCAIAEHSDTFMPRDIPILGALLESHKGGKTFDIDEGERAVVRTGANLDMDRFNLLKKQLEYDEQVFKVHMAKLDNAMKSIYSAKQEWNLKCFRQSQQAAEEWMEGKVHVKVVGDTDSSAAAHHKLVHHMMQKYGVPHEQVLTIGIVNWVAPSTIHNDQLELQASIVSLLTNGSVSNIVPILFPQFSYKKGQLYIVEQMVFNMLAHRAVNVDAKFGLVFEEKPDQRDARRLIYDGRVAVPSGCSEASYVWKDCQLLFTGKTDPASMMPARAMEIVETIGGDALPSTTDADGLVKGAAKFAQVGEDGMAKIINAALKGASISSRQALIIWEINCGVGHALDAFLSLERGWKFPAAYLTTTNDPARAEWIQHTRLNKVRTMHRQGELQVPGFTKMPDEPPVELLEAGPSAPQLHHLVIVDAPGASPGGKSLAIPDSIMDTWLTHPVVGAEFQAYLDTFFASWGKHAVPAAGLKRAADPGGAQPAAPKKAKATVTIVNVEDLPADSEICSVKMTQKGQAGLSLRVGVGNRLHIVNAGKAAVDMQAGSLICGFGKAKFKAGDDGALPDTAHLFMLKGSKDKVLVGKRYADLGSIVEERRQTEPECQVAYHSMDPVADGGPGAFSLSIKHNIYFIPDACNKELIKPDEAKKPPTQQMAVGEVLAASSWASSSCAALVWMVQWGVNGLTPVRPVVLLCEDVSVPESSAMVVL